MQGQSICTLDGSASLTNDQEKGPVLLASGSDKLLWNLLESSPASDLPGRLGMQDDGYLVFYSRYNKALWAINTSEPAGASSKLILSGQYNIENPAESNVLLQVYNYSENEEVAVIYQSSK